MEREPQREMSLFAEVRNALLEVIRDKTAPPTAKAIAGRSLVQLMGENLREPGEAKAPAEMSMRELDAEIAAIQQEER